MAMASSVPGSVSMIIFRGEALSVEARKRKIAKAARTVGVGGPKWTVCAKRFGERKCRSERSVRAGKDNGSEYRNDSSWALFRV